MSLQCYIFIIFYCIFILFIAELHMRPYLSRIYHNNALLYCILYNFNIIITLANTICKLSEDGVLTPKHVGVI